MRFELFIFDFDGTLADTALRMVKLMNRAARKFGFREVDDAEIERLRGLDNRAILRALRVPLWRLPQIAAFARRAAAEEEPAPLFPGIPEALRALHARGARLAVVSSSTETTIRRALEPACGGAIEFYACEASLFGKAAKFKRVLKQSGIAPAKTIAIGDETRDIDAARAAGLARGAVSWGYATPALLQSRAPEFLFKTPEDIASLVA